ncbi:ty3-gypsy retroelement transposase [Cucumis melo var. makuwa]|uniref:Ty3-gypsy retroelement transposase n=1 Tax=Cucumis melo var. makuwa TaxID=1194695 RepID=A0A5A7UTV9_CUCMM|nr:ty3-gypsy retroelement transposase [Cucumis melo var. makuwa]
MDKQQQQHQILMKYIEGIVNDKSTTTSDVEGSSSNSKSGGTRRDLHESVSPTDQGGSGILKAQRVSADDEVGPEGKSTMKVRGKIHGKVVVLNDCGATHNFISKKLVASLKLHTKETSNYDVILGSGAAVKGKGVCEKGMQWLYSLEVKEMDRKNLIITFIHDNKKIIIKGDPSLTKTQTEIQEEVPETEEAVKTVLSKYQDVFDWPEELPQKRRIEHHIHLKAGADPVNVSSYRYGLQQKAEMEKLVDEMLSSGVIRPRTSHTQARYY